MLTALSAYCRAAKPESYHCTLAFLTTRSDEQAWLRNRENGDLLRGARARADSLGFRVDFINIGPTRKAQLQAWAVMQARGIRGAMIRSLPVALADLHLPFEKFPCIDLFSAPMVPELPTVSSYHAQSMELVLGELAQRGYQHPALIVGEGLSEYLHQGWRMVFQVESTRFSQASLYLHQNEVIDFPRLSLWARERNVDALIFGISENFSPKRSAPAT
jgi:LacI family transcriptional regulator